MNSNKYKDYFTKDYLMGPNSVRLVEELLIKNPNAITGGTVLDLGCGKALTSVYIANETNAKTVYATDLWISATENWETIQEWKLEDKMIPIHANALDLPFANDFFDAIVSIDSYHYYGCEEKFFAKKMLPLLKSGGYVLISVPGLKTELEQVPEVMSEWLEDAVDTFHSADWWEKHIQQGCEDLIEVTVYESDQFEACWQDWINTGNEYAINDEKFLNRGLKELLNFVMIVVRKK